MSEENTTFIELPESAQKDVLKLIETFKKQLSATANEAIIALYCDIAPFIANDVFDNFRRMVIEDVCNYHSTKKSSAYDAQRIRQVIFDRYRAEIVADLNQDLLEDNSELKEEVKRLHELLRHRY